MISIAVRPARDEAAEYYHKYIDVVPDGDICAFLDAQRAETLAFLEGIPEHRSRHTYEPGKWTISQVVAHLNDCERLFAFRAFWFARHFDTPLPSFDQNDAMRHCRAEERPWTSHIEEFGALRTGTVQLFSHLPAEAWARRGVASGNPVTVRALAYIAAGHVVHHCRILAERYL